MAGRRKRPQNHSYPDLPRDDSRFSQEIQSAVNCLFQKKFSYEAKNLWSLTQTEPFQDKPWQDETLLQLKERLNRVKCSLSHCDITRWHQHTQRTHRAGQVIQYIRRKCNAELCTQAWCKFHEILAQYPVLLTSRPVVKTLHLCEAPGAFITSLNHFLHNVGFCGQWNWIGNTLNPYYEGNNLGEMIDDDRLIADTLSKWYFGADDTGDVMNLGNMKDLLSSTRGVQPFSLITADGSIDCQNTPGEQEAVTAHLHFCEAVTALSLLTPGGNFVLKMFTLFEHQSVSLMYLLNTAFREVHVVKPATSKPGNSELYVVCLNYQGVNQVFLDSLSSHVGKDAPNTALFSKELIPLSFMKQHHLCCEYFANLQMETIEENRRLFEDMSEEMNQKLMLMRDCCAITYREKFCIQRLDSEFYVVPQFETMTGCKQQRLSFSRGRGRHEGSYNDRIDYHQLTLTEKVKTILRYPVTQASVRWFSSPYALEAADCNWQILRGKRIHQILCSKFCNNKLLQQYNELWASSNAAKKDPASDEESHLRHCTGQSDHSEATTKPDVQETLLDYVWHEVGSFGGKVQLVGETSATERQNSLARFIAERVSERNAISTEGCDVERNLVVSEWITAAPDELNEPKLSSQSWQNFYSCFKMLRKSDHFLYPVSTCLSRFSAGLVYFLYSTFNKIGTFSCPKDDLRWFVALNYKGCPDQLLNYMDHIDSAVQSAHEFPVLEFVSVTNLLEANFASMLKTANNYDLKKKINRLLDRLS